MDQIRNTSYIFEVCKSFYEDLQDDGKLYWIGYFLLLSIFGHLLSSLVIVFVTYIMGKDERLANRIISSFRTEFRAELDQRFGLKNDDLIKLLRSCDDIKIVIRSKNNDVCISRGFFVYIEETKCNGINLPSGEYLVSTLHSFRFKKTRKIASGDEITIESTSIKRIGIDFRPLLGNVYFSSKALEVLEEEEEEEEDGEGADRKRRKMRKRRERRRVQPNGKLKRVTDIIAIEFKGLVKEKRSGSEPEAIRAYQIQKCESLMLEKLYSLMRKKEIVEKNEIQRDRILYSRITDFMYAEDDKYYNSQYNRGENGCSGAPYFNSQGKVVAIHSGGNFIDDDEESLKKKEEEEEEEGEEDHEKEKKKAKKWEMSETSVVNILDALRTIDSKEEWGEFFGPDLVV